VDSRIPGNEPTISDRPTVEPLLEVRVDKLHGTQFNGAVVYLLIPSGHHTTIDVGFAVFGCGHMKRIQRVVAADHIAEDHFAVTERRPGTNSIDGQAPCVGLHTGIGIDPGAKQNVASVAIKLDILAQLYIAAKHHAEGVA